MYPLRLLVCFVLAAALGHAEDSPNPSGSGGKRSVKVEGLVSSPGIIFFPPERGLTITEAIAMAGGHTRRAELRDVTLTRKEPDGAERTRTIDIQAIMRARGKENVTLQSGDVIFVPPRD